MLSESLKDMYISSRLIQKEVIAKNDLEALDSLSSLLINEGIVKDSFKDAIKEREQEFPTGLPLRDIGVAIPHTDSIHVIRQSIAIGILKQPVKFRIMGGSEDELVEVKIMFMLAIKDPHKQVEFLQALVNLMQEDQKIIHLLELRNEEDIANEFELLLNQRMEESTQ